MHLDALLCSSGKPTAPNKIPRGEGKGYYLRKIMISLINGHYVKKSSEISMVNNFRLVKKDAKCGFGRDFGFDSGTEKSL